MSVFSSASVISGAPLAGGGGNTVDGSRVSGQAFEGGAVGFVAVVQPRRVARPVQKLELDEAPVAIERHAALSGEIHLDRRARGVRDPHVPPAAARNQVPDVDHVVGKILEEHLRLHVVLELVGDDAVGDLAELQVGVRERDDHLVRAGGGAQDGDEGHRADQADQADAACLHGHEFPVRRQPAEPDQDAEEDGHGDRDAQRLRQEHVERVKDRRPRDAAGDQGFALLQERRHLKEKGQDDQPQHERQHHLADEIAVERFEHRRP